MSWYGTTMRSQTYQQLLSAKLVESQQSHLVAITFRHENFLPPHNQTDGRSSIGKKNQPRHLWIGKRIRVLNSDELKKTTQWSWSQCEWKCFLCECLFKDLEEHEPCCHLLQLSAEMQFSKWHQWYENLLAQIFSTILYLGSLLFTLNSICVYQLIFLWGRNHFWL